jgi:glycosyltransferase involved in cell wall biosynthesis
MTAPLESRVLMRTVRMLVLATAGHKPAEDDLRRLIAQDETPDTIMADDAVDVTLLDERELLAVKGLRGRLLRALPVPLALAAQAWRRRRDFDVVLSWGERLAFPLAAAMSLTRRPRAGHIAILMWPLSASGPSRLKRLIRRTAVPVLARHGIDRLCVPAPYQRRLVAERWRIPPQRMVAANWPIDTRFWRPLDREADMICSVGREMRDYGTLLEALRPLDIRCHIAAGTGILNDTLTREDARASNVGARSLPAGVTVGPKSAVELRELYARSRIVVVAVLESESDNGITSIAEAMAMGRAVITMKTRGRAEILIDGVNCVLVPVGDPAALRAAIQELWEDPERCARLGAEARARIVAAHGIEQWLSAMRAAAGEPRP